MALPPLNSADWDDDDCVRILRAIRNTIAPPSAAAARPAAASGAGAAAPAGGAPWRGWGAGSRLVIIEMWTTPGLPTPLRFRRLSDLAMLANFGSAKERDGPQLARLLARAGWRETRVWRASGMFCAVEVEPV